MVAGWGEEWPFIEFDIAAFRSEEVFVPFDNEEKPFAFDDDDDDAAASGRMVALPSRRRLDGFDPVVFPGLSLGSEAVLCPL